MSAGTGVTHSEFNLEDEETTLFQIWIETSRRSAPPAWGMMPFPKEAREGSFRMLASGDPTDGALNINAYARILGTTLAAGTSLAYRADPSRHLYLVPSAAIRINGVAASPRDGVAIKGEQEIGIEALSDAELVLVDAA